MKDKVKLLGLVVSTEMLKLRRTVAWWLTIVFPLGSVLLGSLILYAQRDRVSADQVMYINNFCGMVAFFLPFYAVLMVSFFCQIEHRNSMLKHLYALPVTRRAFYYGKLAAILTLLSVAFLLTLIFLYLSFFILGFITPKLRLTSEFAHGYLFLLMARTFISAFALVVIQYLLSMKWKNVVAAVSVGTGLIILPIAVMFVMGITGLITNQKLFQWLPVYNPYSYPFSFVLNVSSGGSVRQEFFHTHLLVWFLAGCLLAGIGYQELRKRNIK